MAKDKKNVRILSIYEDLRTGKVLSKVENAQRFGVDERSIQRDIDDLRAFLSNCSVLTGDSRRIIYDRQAGGYRLVGDPSPLMSNSEILAVSKILLESRAFPKQDMALLIDKLVAGCVPQENSKIVTALLANEKFHYMELTKPVPVQDILWQLGSAIQRRRRLELDYCRQGEDTPNIHRVVEPVGLLFSEYYFYLNAYIVEETQGKWLHRHDWPAIFRVDRIAGYREHGTSFSLPYASRFQEGEFRQRVQFMYGGSLQQIRFRYTGPSVEAVLDRLPTAQIQQKEESGWILQAEVFGEGILMWLLSQGDKVEVLSPTSLRNQMEKILLSMIGRYRSVLES